jgi:hypothetical protein
MGGKRWKIALGTGVLIIGVYLVIGFYFSSVARRYQEQALGRMLLQIPAQQRRQLTDGTTAGIAWLEQQLQARRGSLAALYIIDSMTPDGMKSLPVHRPIVGHCGFDSGLASRWRRDRNTADRLRESMAQEDELIGRYFRDKQKMPLRPLPVVDWTNPLDIEGKALAAIESDDMGLLFVLTDFQVMAASPSVKAPLRFHRVGNRYDVQVLPSGERMIAYERLSGTSAGETRWFRYRIGDSDLDGLPGLATPDLSSQPPLELRPATSQPEAPAAAAAQPDAPVAAAAGSIGESAGERRGPAQGVR